MVKKIIKKIKSLKKFARFNKYMLRALKIKTDKESHKLFLECIKGIAEKNNKDIKEVSLDDVYLLLHKIRKKTPKSLRKVTLYQFLKIKDTTSKLQDISSVAYFLLKFSPFPVIFLISKKLLGNKAIYVSKIYLLSLIAEELYGRTKKTSTELKKVA